jgi:hypothetical protein
MHTVALVLVRSGYNLVVFGLIFAALSYLRTQRFHQQTGVFPWGVPPLVWALLSFFIAIFGTLLSVIACATTKVPGRRGGGLSGSPSTPPGPGRAGMPGAAPSWGSPAAGAPPAPWTPQAQWSPQPPATPPAPGTAQPWQAGPGPTPAVGSAASVGANPPPGWHPDPVARHDHRYWDGDRWTEHVVSAGTPAVDPI